MPYIAIPLNCWANTNSTATTCTQPIWCSMTPTTAATSCTTTTTTRYLWLSDAGNTLWLSGAGTNSTVVPYPVAAPAPTFAAPHIIRPTEEDLLYREEVRQRRLLREREQRLSSQRALDLLLAHLTPVQRETFKANQWFIVEGGKSKRRYRVNCKGHVVANIDALEDGVVSHRLCAHADLEVPFGDQLLAQKLMLEYDEERFLQIANRHRAAV